MHVSTHTARTHHVHGQSLAHVCHKFCVYFVLLPLYLNHHQCSCLAHHEVGGQMLLPHTTVHVPDKRTVNVYVLALCIRLIAIKILTGPKCHAIIQTKSDIA